MAPRASSLTANAAPLACLLAIGLWLVVLFAAVGVLALAVELMATLPLVGLGFLLPGLALAAMGGLGVWAMVDTLRLPGPILTIDRTGVTDRRIGDATLPWAAIDWALVVVSTKRSRGNAVQFYLAGDYPVSPPIRALALANRLLGYPPITVMAMGLDTATPDIAEAFARHKPPMTAQTGA